MQKYPTNFAAILQGMPQPYLVLDTDLVIVGASDAYLALTERSRDDIVGRTILDAFPENPDAVGTVEQGPLEVSLRHVLASGRPHEMAIIQYDIPQPGGGFTQKFWTPVHTPILGQDGGVDYIIQNPMDVTQSVLKSREADARLRAALHAADLATWDYEPESDIWRRSHAVDELFGFEPGEAGPVAAPFFARMHPEDLTAVQREVGHALASPDQTILNFDYRIVLASGAIKYITSRGEVLRTSTGTIRMIGVMMDVTADRVREAELAAAVAAQGELLEQKDLLLAEVNHRVKNSLQLVVSTLRLQARRLEHPATQEAFEQAISRVRAIILVHERLYRTDNSLTVDMADHLNRLCLDLTENMNVGALGVEVDHMELPTERAIPIAVIANELLSSALKQSTAGNSRIVLALKQLPDDMLELSVSDAGRSSSSSSISSLGARLISTMTAQIGGAFAETTTGEGYRATVVFARDGG